MKFSVFQVSRRGGREKNEDRMGYCYTRDSGLFLLADGMGGHPQGEVAAQLALQTVSSLYQQQARSRLPRVNDFLAESLMAAHRRILRHAGENAMRDTPRTTFVAAVLQGGSVSWAHCGDSRLYIVRDGVMLTRTRDHSYLEQGGAELAHIGRINRNVLYTCLGSPSTPAFDVVGPVLLHHGDKILLCSDGLWSSVGDADIVRHLSASSVSQAVPELVELALRKAGEGSDNVTALALEWQAADAFASTCGAGGDTIRDSVFASTIQSADLDDLAHTLDDAAIERTIAEINETIRRTAARKG